MLLRSLVISVCEYNPLCSQIPVDKCLQFDRFLHTKDIKNTKYIVTQPSHATFLSRYHHDLHITSLLPTCASGLTGPGTIPPPLLPLARLVSMGDTSHQHRNLIRDSIVSLVQFGIHYRDADEPVITNTLQLLLHSRPDSTLLR